MMGQFMDYCTYGHMIDNVVLIVTGTLHERDVQVGFARARAARVLFTRANLCFRCTRGSTAVMWAYVFCLVF